MSELTQDRLKEALSYDPETGIFTWKIAPPRKPFLKGKTAGSKQTRGYWAIVIDGVRYKAHRLAWLYVHGYLPANDIDHRDRSTGNNSIENLRPATNSQNLMNKGRQSNNTSGVAGVYWNKCADKWQAYIKINGRYKYLGIYSDFEQAKKVRRDAELRLFGEFAPRAAA